MVNEIYIGQVTLLTQETGEVVVGAAAECQRKLAVTQSGQLEVSLLLTSKGAQIATFPQQECVNLSPP